MQFVPHVGVDRVAFPLHRVRDPVLDCQQPEQEQQQVVQSLPGCHSLVFGELNS